MDNLAREDEFTPLNKREEELQRKIHDYETILNRISDALIGIDRDWNIVYINQSARTIIQPEIDLKGANFWAHFPRLSGSDIEMNFRNSMDNQVPSCFIHHDVYFGIKKWYKIRVYPSTEGITVFIVDVTETVIKEEHLQKLVEERELLIKETHHRVKNNIQLIVSLIHLQAVTTSESTKRELFSLQNRVGSFALLHEHLYRTGSLSKLDIREYLISLVNYIKKTYYDADFEVDFVLDIESHEVETGMSISIGLLVNELVTNSLKYAFSKTKTGTIFITFKKNSEQYELIVSDNGEGLPENIDIENLSSLGLRLVTSLVGQLSGSFEVQSSGGTSFTIKFKGKQE